MKLNWDFLVGYLKKSNAQKIGLCFVIDYHSLAFITRRHKRDYLKGLYELPQGIVNPDETVFEAATRILRDEHNIVLKDITRYLGNFEYVSAIGNQTQMFCFVVEVENVFKIKVKRNDHGTWVQPSEIQFWPIINEYRDCLVNFWYGEGFNSDLSRALIEEAKRENIWRFKVRAVLMLKGRALALKRARRQKIHSLLYEFPGKEISYGQEMDSAIVEAITDQTGWSPVGITGYLGHFDYVSASNHPVREFFYSAIAQDKPIKISEHAYSIWIEDTNNESVSYTPSALTGFNYYKVKTFAYTPKQVDTPPTVYYDHFKASLTPDTIRYLDAMSDLERYGKVDIEALRGKPLIKNSFSPEMQKKLGL